ncbi:MAG: hypothetical protein FJ011_20465 [Chloroflexi bacterium]|nr:hypothetical protein [Chloroflexota bacterium]
MEGALPPDWLVQTRLQPLLLSSTAISHQRPLAALHDALTSCPLTLLSAPAGYGKTTLLTDFGFSIEQIGYVLLLQGLLDTLSGWSRALPAPMRGARPHLARLLGACAFGKGEFGTAQALLEQAVAGFEALDDAARAGESLADLASSAFLQCDFVQAAALAERGLTCPIPPHSRALLLTVRAWLGLFGGDRARAVADLEAAVALAETGDPGVLLMLALNLKSYLAALPGGVECLERFCRLAAAHAAEPISPLRAAVAELSCFTHLWRGRLDEAIQAGESALALNERLGGYPFIGVEAAAALALAYLVRRDDAKAERCFDMMFRQAQQLGLSRAGMAGLLWLLGRARWRQGRLEEARQVYAQMAAAEHPAELPDAPIARLKMQGVLAWIDRRYTDAERVFLQAVALEQRAPIATVLGGSARLLLAQLYLAWNRPDEALAELAPALAECDREGTPGRILLEGAAVAPLLRLAVERNVRSGLAARLLAGLSACAESQPLRVPDTGETLTAREVEVLRLLAEGASNRQIAARLILSENTVKSHVSHILGKRNVSSRGQAAARARELTPDL